jgi:hypothetical protein
MKDDEIGTICSVYGREASTEMEGKSEGKRPIEMPSLR